MSRYLVVLDVDSTLIEDEVIELLAEHAGSRQKVAQITERAMRGEIDFAESLRERVATLAGLPDSIFDEVRSQVTLTNGALDLISTVHQHNGIIGVVSGGFHEILDPLAESINLDVWQANRLEITNGFLTGKVLGPIIDAKAKQDALVSWAQQWNIGLPQTVAVGDGANDLLMMQAAGLGVAFCAKPVVQAQADVSITTRDLSLVAQYLDF